MLQEVTRPLPAQRASSSNKYVGAVSVDVKGLVKRYGAVVGVAAVDFHLDAGKTATLLGPSGCGKTTTLRCIAGLEVPNEGQISFGERRVYDSQAGIILEPEQRDIGMVFQSYAIWPHMTVAGNVGYPLKVRKAGKDEIDQKVNFILSLVGLGDMGGRPASNLSGGQQQRVALARALVHRPRIVLFDEPLSNLDANLRERMRAELLLLQAELGFTAIYVTHDQEEAMALSDEVIVMNRGKIEQRGDPVQVFQKPATLFAARFLGCTNVMTGQVVARLDDGTTLVEVAPELQIQGNWRETSRPAVGEAVGIAFRPDIVALGPNLMPTANVFEGQVLTAAFLGHAIDYTIKVGALTFRAEISPETGIPAGSVTKLQIPVKHAYGYRLKDQD